MVEKTNSKTFYSSQIPNDWEVKKLESFAKFFSGGTPHTGRPEYYCGNIPFIKSGEIYFDKTDHFITEEGLANSSAKMVDIGDLLYALYGANSGEVAISQIKGAINQAVLCIRQNSLCDKVFIYYYLLREKENIIKTYLQGGQGNLSAEIVRSLQIPLPSLPEQKAIASLLSKWDEAISKNQSLIEQKVRRKKWLMQNLLTGKKRLMGFNDRWADCMVSELFRIVDRYVKWDDNEKYNLVSIKRRNGGLFFREPLYGVKIAVKKLKEIKIDDFLISKRQVSHGAWAIVTKEFENGKVSDEYDCLAIQDESKLSSQFWKWYCQLPVLTHYAYVDSNGVHIEKSIFDYNQFKRRRMRIPCDIKEQVAIAKVLQAVDKELQLLKVKTEKLKEQKKGLMQVLLTGKKRLKID